MPEIKFAIPKGTIQEESLEMLKKAGYAIAMQDAPQEVKDIADLIISSSDTGAVISYLKERENILINSNDEFSEL